MAAAVIATVLAATPVSAAPDPAVAAQQLVYELNLARWNPVLFVRESGAAMPVVAAAPPLALHAALTSSAVFKADEMADGGYFAHRSAVTGVWPNRLVRDFGYPLPAAWPDDENFVESLQRGSADPSEVVRALAESPSHRAHVFGENGFRTFPHIGVGRSSTGRFWAVHIAIGGEPAPAVTGVVFDDRDGDGRMDPGEGLAGIPVTTGARATTTNAGGGYTLPLGAGVTTVIATVRGERLSGTFTPSGYSVGVDFIAGRTRAIVRSYELCDGLPPTMLGTDGDDVIVGTPGSDVIHGLGGRDTIKGLGGDDVICGGAGPDRLLGGAGDDVLIGGPGSDRLRGGAGTDKVFRGSRIRRPGVD